MPRALKRYLALGLVALFAAGLAGCNYIRDMDDDSEPLPEKRAGEISPLTFVFAQVTDVGTGPGGWWAGCLHLHLLRGQADEGPDSRVTCDIEIGIPIVTDEDGRISMRRAQQVAADATNQAVATVARGARLTTDICTDVQKTIKRAAHEARKGSRVNNRCGKTFGPVPEFAWP